MSSVLPPAGFVEGIIVNGKGQRIINEDSYHGRVGEAILRNPQEKHYLVLDSRQFGDLEHPPLGGFRVVATGETVGELEAELKLPPARSVSRWSYTTGTPARARIRCSTNTPTTCERWTRGPGRPAIYRSIPAHTSRYSPLADYAYVPAARC